MFRTKCCGLGLRNSRYMSFSFATTTVGKFGREPRDRARPPRDVCDAAISSCNFLVSVVVIFG